MTGSQFRYEWSFSRRHFACVGHIHIRTLASIEYCTVLCYIGFHFDRLRSITVSRMRFESSCRCPIRHEFEFKHRRHSTSTVSPNIDHQTLAQSYVQSIDHSSNTTGGSMQFNSGSNGRVEARFGSTSNARTPAPALNSNYQ
jgi:hypothetical protein